MDRDRSRADGVRLVDGREQPLSQPQGPREILAIPGQDGELVAAEPGGDVLVADGLGNPLAHGLQERVPNGVPQRVVDELEVVEVEEQDGEKAAAQLARGQPGSHGLAEQGTVRQAGQGVVVRLVVELLLELGEPGERLLELAVLQRDGDVARERLEQAEVGRVERADVAQPVRDHQRSDHPVLSDQWRDHLVAEPGTRARSRGGHEDGPTLREGGLQQRVVHRRPHGQHRLRRCIGPACRAEQLVAFARRQQGQLREVRPEHRPGVCEQLRDRMIHLRAPLEDSGGLVQHLQPLRLLALRDVRPVRDVGDGDRHREQHGRAGLVGEHDEREQREAGVGQRDQQPGAQHLRDPVELTPAFRQGDRARDRDDAQHVLCDHRAIGGRPFAGPEAGAARDEHVDDGERDHRPEEELGQVEHELRGSLPPRDRQREPAAQHPGDDERDRVEEEQPEYQRDLGHRERVGAPADVEVDDPRLGHVEQERDHGPRDGDRERAWCRGRQLGDGEHQGQQEQATIEHPDPLRPRRAAQGGSKGESGCRCRGALGIADPLAIHDRSIGPRCSATLRDHEPQGRNRSG